MVNDQLPDPPPPRQSDDPSPSEQRQRRYVKRGAVARERIISRVAPARRVDSAIFTRVNSSVRHRRLDGVASFLALVFNGGWAWIIATALLLPVRRTRARARHILKVLTVPTWVAALGVEGPIKRYFRRQRPFHVEQGVVLVGREPSNYSFPSGHAAAAFGGARMMQRLLPRWAWLWYAIASLVAWSRVYLGVHYPSDVTMGAVLGTLLAESTYRVQRRIWPSADAGTLPER